MRESKFLNVAQVKNSKKVLKLLPKMANRHGLITGATGTGKTVTLQVMAEEFSRLGVPVFLADVKGDLSGMAEMGELTPKLKERIELVGLTNFSPTAFPVTFFDVFGEKGLPARTTVTAMGPLLISRLLNLNATQQGVMSIIFQLAKANQLPLVTMDNLQSALRFCSLQDDAFEMTYGRASRASLAAIQRNLVTYEDGVSSLFQLPQFDIRSLIRFADDKRGFINILAADKLMLQPRTYSTFLLWIMTELFKILPEVGDVRKPKLAFFFDEAHLLFLDAPAVLLEKIEQVVRLIRSKGVGIYFVTQNPIDIPETVLGQLSNRVQHALRAFTPKDARAVKFAADTFRSNPGLDVEEAITELGIGEALVSFLDEKGHPTIVERAYVFPPRSKIGPVNPNVQKLMIEKSELSAKYSVAPSTLSVGVSPTILTVLEKAGEILDRTDPKKRRLWTPQLRNRRGKGGFSIGRMLGLYAAFRIGRGGGPKSNSR